MYPALNLPAYPLRMRNQGAKTEVFDELRRKFVRLTPEEWVRQHLIHYLRLEKGYPKSLMSVEMPVLLFGMQKRSDVVVFDPNGKPLVIIECKAPQVAINQQVLDQAAAYNLPLQSVYFLLSNGLSHIFCRIDYQQKRYEFLPEIPAYFDLATSGKD